MNIRHRMKPSKKRVRRGVGILGVLGVLQLAMPGRANAQTGIGPVDWVIDGVGDLIGGGVGAVAAKVAQTIFTKVFEFVAGLIAAAVTKATELLISVFDAIDVKVDAKGMLMGTASSKLQLQMIAFGGFMVMLLFLIRLCSALMHNQMGQVARELFFDLPFTIIGTAAAGAIGFIFLQVSNAMASSFSQDFAENIGKFSGEFFTVDAIMTGGFFTLIFALVYIFGAIVVGIELIIRASLLTITFAVAPAMISTRTWEGTRRFSRKFIEVSLALMFAKPAAAFALALGTAQLSDSATALSPVKLIIGTTITVLAAFMPFAIFKLIPVVEGAAVQQGIKGAPVRVAQTVLGLGASAALIQGALKPDNAGGGGQASGGTSGGSGTGGAGSGPTSGGGSPAAGSTQSGPVPSGGGRAGTGGGSRSGGSGGAAAAPAIRGAGSGGTPNQVVPDSAPSPAAVGPESPHPDVSSSPAGSSMPAVDTARRDRDRKAQAMRTAVGSIPTKSVAFADSFFTDEEKEKEIIR
jgi:hypothetical protein